MSTTTEQKQSPQALQNGMDVIERELEEMGNRLRIISGTLTNIKKESADFPDFYPLTPENIETKRVYRRAKMLAGVAYKMREALAVDNYYRRDTR